MVTEHASNSELPTPYGLSRFHADLTIREIEYRKRGKYGCIDKIMAIFSRILPILLLFIFLGDEAAFFTMKGLRECRSAIRLRTYQFGPGKESLKIAARKFFGMLISPLGIVFPKAILIRFASDDVVISQPCKIALAQFEKWSSERQLRAWKYAVANKNTIDPVFFEILHKWDIADIAKTTSLQLMYQRFSICNRSDNKVKFEGCPAFNWRTGYQAISDSMSAWVALEEGQPYRKIMQEVIELFKTSIKRNNIDLAAKLSTQTADWRCCPSGFTGHANCYIITPKLIVKIDTGTTKDRGIKLYHITKENRSAKQKLSSTLDFYNLTNPEREKHKKNFNKAKSEMGLKRVAWFKSQQVSGSCSYTAPLASAFAILLLKELYRQSDVSSLTQEQLDAAAKTLYPIFIKWNHWDRLESFKKEEPLIAAKDSKNHSWIMANIIRDSVREKDLLTIQEILNRYPHYGDLDLSHIIPGVKTLIDFVAQNNPTSSTSVEKN